MCLNYTCIIFFFNLRLHVFQVQFCCFRIGRGKARNYRAFEKKSISYFMNTIYKRIFLNFCVISFINKEVVSLFQLHTYKFGLVYILSSVRMSKKMKMQNIVKFATYIARESARDQPRTKIVSIIGIGERLL